MSIEGNVARVRRRIEAACDRAGRDAAGVRLVAVAKGQSADDVRRAVDAGVADIGENRAQELRDKRSVLEGVPIRWHFVGAVQTNKVRYLDGVALVHSVDRPEEAEALSSRGPHDVLVEVNVAAEASKQGIAPDRLPGFLAGLTSCEKVSVKGLMFLAPRAAKPEDIRWVFAEARRLRDRIRGTGAGLEELSMGMSEDFEVAVEEGATLVRVGRAIFREE